ncbi:uncharacterized protein LOC110807725 [Carica papaya]|uniref:uncharacterized protein LOC110807725 n=1 Tax=Carica papaya TaxID=3649 RepID=UPI000B8C8004|nr:uncharacterized protein LOC110807725 [Carica papaya]
MGTHIFFCNNSSRPLSLIKLSRSCLYTQVKSYSESGKGRKKSENKGNGHEILIEQERASSTADEFKKVAEEKVRMATEQGVRNQTVEKTFDATGEAIEHADVESARKSYSQHEGGAKHHKSEDD